MLGTYSYTPYIWPMLLSAMVSAALAVYAWRHRAQPGATPFAAHELFLSLWALFTAVEMAAADLPTKVVYHKLEAVAAIIALSAMLWFALEHAGPDQPATRRRVRLLWLLTVLPLFFMATNQWHHWIWLGFWFDGFTRVHRGPLNFLLLIWALLPMVLAILLFLRLLSRARGVYRQQALLLSVGAFLPLLTFVLEPAGINPIAPLDPVILVQNVSSLLYALAIFRFRMLEVVPIGRDTAIERMANGVVVLDAQKRIVDLNPAASHVLALSRRETLGCPAGQALAAYPDLSRVLEQKTVASAELTLSGTGEPRTFQVQASPLTHPGGYQLGQLLLLQDVTEQRKAQAQLLEQQWARATLQERELLADELHDGLSQNLAFLNLQAQAAEVYLQAGESDAARASVARLAQAARELQSDTREWIGQLLAVSQPSEGFCTTLRQMVDRFEKQNSLSVHLDIVHDADAACDPSTLPPASAVQLLRIAQEALANVRKHAGAPTQVGVELRAEAGQLQLAVADNGVGFDPAAARPGGKSFGLEVMRQRAARIGGALTIRSAPGQGTRVEVRVPLVQ